MLSFVLLVAGIILLIWGADRFVSGASALAQRLGVSSLIIGLTIVSFGTSAPELAVSVTASLKHANDLCFANVIGSNLFNLLMITGVSALVAPLVIDKVLIKRDMVASLVATACMTVFILIGNNVSRIEGILLLAGFATVLFIQIYSAVKDRSKSISTAKSPMKIPRMIIYILIGLGCVIGGGQLTVTSASAIAASMGVSQSLIGLTIVAVGTSLPELVTSLVAARRGQNGIAMGNVIGSNIFNALFILGTASVINPIRTDIYSLADTIILLVATAFLFITAKFFKVCKKCGLLLTVCYCSYIVFACIR